MSTNDKYKQLESAKQEILDKNMPLLDKSGIKVVSCKIEEHKKYGLQCMIILQASDE